MNGHKRTSRCCGLRTLGGLILRDYSIYLLEVIRWICLSVLVWCDGVFFLLIKQHRVRVREKYNREVYIHTANFFSWGVVYGSVVCTPPTRRSVYTYQWKCIEVYTIYTLYIHFFIYFQFFSYTLLPYV